MAMHSYPFSPWEVAWVHQLVRRPSPPEMASYGGMDSDGYWLFHPHVRLHGHISASEAALGGA